LEYYKNKKVRLTKNKLPFELVYTEDYKSRLDAQTRKYQIKKWKSGKAVERLFIK